jgi:hypothetical protein
MMGFAIMQALIALLGFEGVSRGIVDGVTQVLCLLAQTTEQTGLASGTRPGSRWPG